MSCRGFLTCTLKLFNFILTLAGVAIILYSTWMLKKWHTSTPPAPSPHPFNAPPPSLHVPPDSGMQLRRNFDWEPAEKPQPARSLLAKNLISSLDFNFSPKHLPPPWFIYTFLGMGITVCLITCCGHIGAETMNGCCLSCYTVFVCLLIVIEAAAAAFVFLNHRWEEEIPDDPTGQFDYLKEFVKENFDICKWVALVVLAAQALAVVFALLIRALGPVPRGSGYDSDDDYVPPRPSLHQPLLNHQTTQGAAMSTVGTEVRPSRSDAWTTRMQQKYGLDTTELPYNSADSKKFSTSTEGNRKCAIM